MNIFILSEDPVDAAVAQLDKAHIAKWTNRAKPKWWI